MQVILPKQQVDVNNVHHPIFFLAGPILGGGDWQYEMAKLIKEYCNECFLATPSVRYGEGHPLEAFHAELLGYEFPRQLPWERYYLEQAAFHGCVIFWLPCESKTHPRIDGLPYAMDTRGELGEWRGRLMSAPFLKVVVGAELEFPGLSQIQRNFSEALKEPFPIYGSMEETVQAALRMANR